MFETETIAELCLKQGLVRDALEIYRRLLASATDEPTRARRARRVADLELRGDHRTSASDAAGPATPPPPPTEIVARHDDREVTLEWKLPAGTPVPAAEILVVRRDANGIATERRTVRLPAPEGRITLPIAGVHSLRAAAGRLDGERFVPLVRLAARAAATPPEGELSAVAAAGHDASPRVGPTKHG